MAIYIGILLSAYSHKLFYLLYVYYVRYNATYCLVVNKADTLAIMESVLSGKENAKQLVIQFITVTTL